MTLERDEGSREAALLDGIIFPGVGWIYIQARGRSHGRISVRLYFGLATERLCHMLKDLSTVAGRVEETFAEKLKEWDNRN